MAKPHVTITLGRSGQKVVKESWGDVNGGRANASGKRSLEESYGSSADRSFSNKKRMRGDVNGRGYGTRSHIDESRLGPKDLRLKLTRKRISRRMELESEERKKIELHEKVSRAIRSLESPDNDLSRSTPSSRGTAGTPQVGSMRSTYGAWTSYGARTTSPEIIRKSFGGMTTTRSVIDELPRVPPRGPIDASRTDRVLMSSPLDSTRPKVPVFSTSRHPLDSGKQAAELPPTIGGISRSPYQDTQPLTVSSLLQSLGLGKYSINFRAEEIDMVALRQMGDHDLKELGIPMGPRKKLLLALQARAKRPVVTQAPGNYMQ